MLVTESYDNGFIVSDISGYRGRFGVAFTGMSGEWKSQPIGLKPFPTEEEAENYIDSLNENK